MAERNAALTRFGRDARENAKAVKALFAENTDLTERVVHGADGAEYVLLFLDGVVDKEALQRFVILPLSASCRGEAPEARHAAADVKLPASPREAAKALCCGSALLFSPGGGTQALELRKPQPDTGKESSPENIVLGPHARFRNSCRSNLALLRDCIRTPDLASAEFTLQSGTLTKVAVCYISGVADGRVVEAVKRRVFSCASADVKSVTEFIELFKEDRLSPFPQYVTSERPDRVTEALLRGCVAVIPDGSPWAILAPVSFADFLKSPEDSHSPWIYTSLIRLLRLVSVAITIITPALYVAVMSFHPRMLPVKLMLSAASGRAAVPLPAIAEVVIMEIFIELLREASASMPSNVGSTISIVGGIVIGEAAISAGLASPLLVVIIAISAVTSFTIPVYSMVISLRTVRFFSLLLASVFGFYGLIMSLIFMAIHMASLKSMGEDYLFPVAPMRLKRWKRDLVRFPLRWVRGDGR